MKPLTMFFRSHALLLLFTCWLAASPLESRGAAQQEAQAEEARAVAKLAMAIEPAQEEQKKAEPDAPAESTDQSAEAAEPLEPPAAITSIDGREIRFHMWDGLIVGGEATVDAIDVETEFGSLRIPIDKIMRFYPGLDSMTELQQKIDRLVEELGDRNFEVREKAHNELLKMGRLLEKEIYRFEDG